MRGCRHVGVAVHFLTRGHGGSTRGPLLVVEGDAADVGDEARLLAAVAPTWIAHRPLPPALARRSRPVHSFW